MVDFRFVLSYNWLNEGLVQLAGALEAWQQKPEQKQQLQHVVEGYPRHEERRHRLQDREEREDDPVREPLGCRVQAVRLQSLEGRKKKREKRERDRERDRERGRKIVSFYPGACLVPKRQREGEEEEKEKESFALLLRSAPLTL